MAVRNCVGNKCITSAWEGCLIISHQPVYVIVCMHLCVSVERGEMEYLKGVKCQGYPSKEH